MVRLISRPRGGLAALKLTELFGINDSFSYLGLTVLIIIIYCYLIIIIIIVIITITITITIIVMSGFMKTVLKTVLK